MKKNKKIFILTLLSLAIIPEIILAEETLGTTKYLMCDEKRIPFVLPQMVSTFMTIIKIAIPILLVISGMIAFFKVTFASNVEDQMKKAKTKLVNNIIAAVIIFFIFSIINFAVSLVAGANNSFMSCAKCFINTDGCETADLTDEELKQGFIKDASEYDSNKKTEEEDLELHQNTDPNTEPTQAPKADPDKFEIKVVDGVTYVYDYKIGSPSKILIANKTYGLPSDYAPYGIHEDCIKQECFEPYTWRGYDAMSKAAKEAGIKNFNIISGNRSYDRQSKLYSTYKENYGSQEAADAISARPGHSEHQTGLAMDLIDPSSERFPGTAEAQWINDNCYKYGFIVRYPKGKEKITGYNYEPWHLRFVGITLAKILYNNGNWITLEEYYGLTSEYPN